MHRAPLLQILAGYDARYPDERATVARVRELVVGHADCFERTCLPGHITGSAWILSPDRQSVLLTHHRKLDRWLQLGGHADGDPDPLSVACRESREESGMESFDVLDGGAVALPLDIDVHRIPATAREPEHWHHDLRYLLVAHPGQRIRVSPESKDLAWIERRRLVSFVSEESLLRMERKTRALLLD